MSWLGRSGAVAALLAVAFLAVGCGETVIDDAKTEAAIEQNLEKSVGQKVSSVDCPSGVEVEAGATFTCTVSSGRRQAGDGDAEDPQHGRRRRSNRPQGQ